MTLVRIADGNGIHWALAWALDCLEFGAAWLGWSSRTYIEWNEIDN